MKIISNGLASGTRIYTDDGQEITGVSKIDFDPIRPGGLVNAKLSFNAVEFEYSAIPPCHLETLKKYIDYVKRCNGVSLIERLNDRIPSDNAFTEDEVRLLESLDA